MGGIPVRCCPAVENRRTDHAFVVGVLELFSRTDEGEMLLWHVNGGEVHFAANCSDCFAWASADAEPIATIEDLRLANRCAGDLTRAAIEAGEDRFVAWLWLPYLYAARKRGERPMPRFMEGVDEPYRPLFEAAGPERESAIWAP